MSDPGQQEETISAGALTLPPEERAAYLAEACGADAQLLQCVEAGLKKHEKGGDMDEWPHDLRVRDFPSEGREEG